MSPIRLVRLSSVIVVLAFVTLPVQAEQPAFRYTEGKHGKGELKYVNGLPVLAVAGTPDEIGEQIGALTGPAMTKLLTFPKGYIKLFGYESAWPVLVQLSKGMTAQFPPDHLKELDTFTQKAEIDRDLALVGNTLADIKKFGGCSTLIVEADRSATKGPLFGRNLDYPTLGFLNDYTLVTVYRPEGKHAFASVGFPGLVGCLSGINDKGLAVAVLEVYSSNDNSARFDPKGVPYAMCYRRILEECSTVDEAEKLLRSLKRTTRNNLAICDVNGGAVFEITPANLVVRRSQNDFCACTNHFRTKQLARGTQCPRYRALARCQESERIDAGQLWRLLDSANQDELTLQTMIFEPATLKLHLAIGKCPTSALEPKVLELRPLLIDAKP